ncbi:MAG: ABC transporter permease [Rhodothermaceae bacterium]|nr:ABC transporter permease [Rhodothermaceae bacterium]
MKKPFDLNSAISAWRHFQSQTHRFLEEDLDELEVHLRAHTDDLQQQGWSQEAAFREAVHSLGDPGELETEYSKVRWSTLKHRRKLTDELRWRGAMLRNYIKIALRSLLHKKGYALLNIIGLAIGMASCLIIFLYVTYETSFDQFNTKIDRIYRGGFEITRNGERQHIRGETAFNLGPTMAEDVPNIIQYARIQPNYGSAVFSVKEGGKTKTFKEDSVIYADSSFLDLFDYPLINGDKSRALADPRTVLISASMAHKYFGDADPLGRTLDFNGWVRGVYTVTGVFADVPATSHLPFDFLLPMHDLLRLRRFSNPERGWDRLSFATYFEIAQGADIETVENAITRTYYEHRSENLAASNTELNAHLQPLSDIHLNADISGPIAITGDRKKVYFFLLICLVTFLIALVNYVNLATARATDRAKEVGVRKVVGAQKKQLVEQFLTESLAINGIALIVAIALSLALVPVLNQIAGIQLSPWDWMTVPFFLFFLVVIIPCVLLAGFYPAFILSSFKPATVFNASARTLRLRKTLIVVQFAASIILLIGTSVIYSQLSFMREKDMGFELDQVVVVENPRIRGAVGRWASDMATLKNKLQELPAISTVGLSSTTPGGGFNWYSRAFKVADDPSEGSPVRSITVDHDFIDVYGLDILAGEAFREGMPLSDAENPSVLVNENLVRRLGFTSNEEAVGQQIASVRGGPYTIHGVVNKFNWSSAHIYSEAVILFYETRYGEISMAVQAGKLPEVLPVVQQIYEDLFPGNPFLYHFADDVFDAQYKSDQTFASLFALFAGLAVFIACLGLFGLASFEASRRTKEIGVRKVLGASTGSLIGMLSRDFLKLVGVAFFIAIPVAYITMNRWLDGFAYHIQMGPGIYLFAALVTLMIASLTISFHTVKAALGNPIKALRYE